LPPGEKPPERGKGRNGRTPPQFEEDLSRFFNFTLTKDQGKACRDIIRDLGSGKPMNRLLLGMWDAAKQPWPFWPPHFGILNNALIAVMAPSQVLANQHFDYFRSLSREMGFRPMLLTGALKKAERKKAYEKIRSGSCNVVIGTQSLIQDDLLIPNLGLVVIDEQQRFGVRERALMDRKGMNPTNWS
jgi:ATP-dependent DNA helicase RecG